VSADSGVVGLELSLKAVVRSHVGTQLAHVVQSVGVAHSLRAHQVTARRPWRTDTHTTPTHHSHRCKEAKEKISKDGDTQGKVKRKRIGGEAYDIYK